MAAYATIEDAIAIYGEPYVSVLCDRDDNGLPDRTALTRHLEIATSHMDGYLLGHYPLPLANPPAHFVKLCVDIALYNAAPTQDVRTDELRQRAEDATRYLELLAAGKVRLETAEDIVGGGTQVLIADANVRPSVRGFPPAVLKAVL